MNIIIEKRRFYRYTVYSALAVLLAVMFCISGITQTTALADDMPDEPAWSPPVNVDGTIYPLTFAGVQAAITAAGSTPTEIVLCGNIAARASFSDVITVNPGQNIKIVSDSTQRTLDGGGVSGGIKAIIINNGTLWLENVLISNSNNPDTLGAVSSAGTLNLLSGSVITNTSGGSGVYSTGTCNINGGTISNNTSTIAGGIYNFQGTLNIFDGTITNNKAVIPGPERPDNVNGGGVYNYNGTCNMYGGEISNNTTSHLGGGIYNNCTAGNAGKLTITGGKITGNSAHFATSVQGEGGGIYNASGLVSISGDTEISGNTADAYGGGLVNRPGGVMEISGEVKITNNKAEYIDPNLNFGYGGGISNFGIGSLTISGNVEIIGNAARIDGGGIHNYAAGEIIISGCTISGNVAQGLLAYGQPNMGGGGGIHNRTNGVITISNSTITGNKALADISTTGGGHGGAIYNEAVSPGNSGIINISGSIIEDNYAARDGGGIFSLSDNAKNNYQDVAEAAIIITDSEFNNNSAPRGDGGAIYTVPTENGYRMVKTSGVTFSGNTAQNSVDWIVDTQNDAENISKIHIANILNTTYSVLDAYTANPATNNAYNNFDINYILPQYNVRYDGGATDAIGSMTDPDSPYDVSNEIDILENEFTRSGYIFIGFKIEGDNSGTIYAADSDGIRNAENSFFLRKHTVLVAQWIDSTIKYSVTYDSNGGTGSYVEDDIDYDDAHQVLSVTATGITRSGYTFLGWNTRADGTGADYAPDDILYITGDITLYAQWQADQTQPPDPPTPPDIDDEGPELDTTNHFSYIVGYEDGTVRPEAYITRAEVATIFFRLLTDASREKFWSTTNSYIDTVSTMWYNNAISTVTKAELFEGYPDNTFAPGQNLTRAEFATLAARYARKTGILPIGESAEFSDIAGHWAEEDIKFAGKNGYVNGYGNGKFIPDNYITRAEAVTLINRILDRHVDSDDDLLSNMKVWPDNKPGGWYYYDIQEATNSHYYTRVADERTGTWTALRTDPDWLVLEVPGADWQPVLVD